MCVCVLEIGSSSKVTPVHSTGEDVAMDTEVVQATRPVSFVYPFFFSSLLVFMDNLLIWNCRGAGNSRFSGLIHDYARIYDRCFLAILEPWISELRADNVIGKLGATDGST